MTTPKVQTTLMDLIPIFRQMPRTELIRAADWLLDYAPTDSLNDQLRRREEQELAESPLNPSERSPGVITYPFT